MYVGMNNYSPRNEREGGMQSRKVSFWGWLLPSLHFCRRREGNEGTLLYVRTYWAQK